MRDGELSATRFDDRLLVGARVLLLVFSVFLALAYRLGGSVGAMVLALGLIAALASLRPASPKIAALLALGEAILGVAIISVPETAVGLAFLPYLIAPALGAGLRLGAVAAAVVALAAGSVWFVLAALEGTTYVITVTGLQWILMSLLVGLVGAYARRIRQDVSTASNRDLAAYEDAYRLLSELRGLTRRMSSGLHPAAIAETVVEHAEQVAPGARASVLVRSEGTDPIHLAGADVEAELDETDRGLLRDVWASQAVTGRTTAAGRQVLIIPLRVGQRTVGLLVLSLAREATAQETADLRRTAAEGALRLETALLFEEVRGVATAEERRRLAREIHDGIAQDIASLGYLIDDVADDAPPPVADRLQDLRAEIGRVVDEVRFSIFDLRSQTTSTAGLGTALSDHARAVGSGSGMVVHLHLDETPPRLPATVEAEVLRIAQEAITNARKHAQPANLWVTLRVASPAVSLEVADDGPGMGPGRRDSFGMQIMSERAQRIGATLSIGPRAGGGTVVTLRRLDVTAEQEAATHGAAGSHHRRP